MKFPKLTFWSNHGPGEEAGRIDQALHDRNHRLCVGLSIAPTFSDIEGVLVVSQGNGKYLRICHVVGTTLPIPKALGADCVGIVNGESSPVGDLAQLGEDLAEIQAEVVGNLKSQAGKYVDRVLAISVMDPGYWAKDFDGRISYSPLGDATRLAELSGVSVIDAFPSRDLTVGGNGKSLESLPLWILFSDRNRKVANQSRRLITFNERTTQYWIPASDGLDAEIPELKRVQTMGLEFLHLSAGLEKFVCHEINPGFEFSAMNYQEQQFLIDQWNRLVLACMEQSVNRSSGQDLRVEHLSNREYYLLSMRLASVVDSLLEESPGQESAIVMSAIEWVSEMANRVSEKTGLSGSDHLIVAGPSQLETILVQQLERMGAASRVSSSQIFCADQGRIGAVTAAVLGLFHIDQMPANIPWLTGAGCQRILGRLTPGRPANWRHLIRTMADFHPAPMKLKDAI